MTREQALETILSPHGPPQDLEQRRLLKAWLDRDPELRAIDEQQRDLFAAMDLWESVEPSSGFNREVYARVDAEQVRRSGWGRLLFGSWKPALAAGLAAAALVIGAALWQPSDLTPAPQVAVKALPAADAEYLREIDRALDDMEMLSEFDAFLQEANVEGRS